MSIEKLTISIHHIHKTLLEEINELISTRDKHKKWSPLWAQYNDCAATLCYQFGPLCSWGRPSDLSTNEFEALQLELQVAANKLTTTESKPATKQHRACKSLDGNTPLKLMSKKLDQELSAR